MMSLEQLIAVASIKDCSKCGLRHAEVRTCEEAQLEEMCAKSMKKLTKRLKA